MSRNGSEPEVVCDWCHEPATSCFCGGVYVADEEQEHFGFHIEEPYEEVLPDGS